MAFHSTWIRSELEAAFTGSPHPGSMGNFFMCLADSATLTEFSPTADFFAAELAIGTNGYQRKPIAFTGPALFDNATKTASLPTKATTWTPTGGSLQFQTVFLIAGGAATGTVGAIVFVHREPQIMLKQASQPYQFEITMKRSIP